ncbi:MAG: hypothetical protein EOR25_15685 [Mesorhizobium sp.]|uniref:hypothetical protein n=1 Tax=Mesorhizobium sp. TaxID=1871066 RepID=UPI000FE413DD|nr:hypothetical protein [Mesorhizobium sp.]RWI47591.1 MAG: hypothetical protein EOR15_14015 [Mesorhizobium sp.]RWI88225.1 MAG: hypothetical protein EOR20_04070 [Mesorhizobium sp.]RWJ09635.1 MAG: hypothetical protein EOR24_18285 [Mesorhizobium sp.]RWJ16332.1 MAG: hypothetical protein EOR25_15685 [Mesorhizobium sp.]RWJ56814.1 MAG: hypothetical protein EOR32_33240 [Mesorhizobium sp.]
MQIQVYEPLTGDVLSRADVANMKLPFEKGWDTWWVTSPTGRILGQHASYKAAQTHLHILNPLPIAA